MFLTAAHSFKQQARLAITLAWVAGYTNIVALLACGTVTSHMTGAASNLGRGIAERDWSLAGFELFLIGAFLIGAVLAGVATEVGRRRAWESIYVLPMALEALLLAGFAIGIEVALHNAQSTTPADPGAAVLASTARPMLAYLLIACAAAAMGLQNATITRISSGVVRTTHITGVLTDMGLEVVQAVESIMDALRTRRRAATDANPATIPTPALSIIRLNPHARRLALLASIVASFVLGAGLGVVVFQHVSMQWAMFPPVLFLAWIIAQDLRKPIAEIEPSELVARGGLGLPPWLAVFHLANDGEGACPPRTFSPAISMGEHGARPRPRPPATHAKTSTPTAKLAAKLAPKPVRKPPRIQRLPDLVAWLTLVPESVRVIVLDLTDVAALEEDAGLQLRAAVLSLREQGRELIVSGVTDQQFQQLQRIGAGDLLDARNVCPDLELAIARGLGMDAMTSAMTPRSS